MADSRNQAPLTRGLSLHRLNEFNILPEHLIDELGNFDAFSKILDGNVKEGNNEMINSVNNREKKLNEALENIADSGRDVSGLIYGNTATSVLDAIGGGNWFLCREL